MTMGHCADPLIVSVVVRRCTRLHPSLTVAVAGPHFMRDLRMLSGDSMCIALWSNFPIDLKVLHTVLYKRVVYTKFIVCMHDEINHHAHLPRTFLKIMNQTEIALHVPKEMHIRVRQGFSYLMVCLVSCLCVCVCVYVYARFDVCM